MKVHASSQRFDDVMPSCGRCRTGAARWRSGILVLLTLACVGAFFLFTTPASRLQGSLVILETFHAAGTHVEVPSRQSTGALVHRNPSPTPLPSYNVPASRLRPDDLNVCIIVTTLLDTGGTENWLFSLVHAVFHKPPFVVHAMKVASYWSHGAVQNIHARQIRFNPSDRELVDECDVIVETGTRVRLHRLCAECRSASFWLPSLWLGMICCVCFLFSLFCVIVGTLPIPAYKFMRPTPRILVVHGAKILWTEAYAAKASAYSAIVAVSPVAAITVPLEQRPRVQVIPPMVLSSRWVQHISECGVQSAHS